jgi:hypothetical protein
VGLSCVLAVEWAEKWPRPPADAIRVSIVHAGDTGRAITVSYSDR